MREQQILKKNIDRSWGRKARINFKKNNESLLKPTPNHEIIAILRVLQSFAFFDNRNEFRSFCTPVLTRSPYFIQWDEHASRTIYESFRTFFSRTATLTNHLAKCNFFSPILQKLLSVDTVNLLYTSVIGD